MNFICNMAASLANLLVTSTQKLHDDKTFLSQQQWKSNFQQKLNPDSEVLSVAPIK